MISNILINRGTERNLCIYLIEPSSLRGKESRPRKTKWQRHTLHLIAELRQESRFSDS